MIAPSFGDIFYNNSLKNGFLPVRLDEKVVEAIIEKAKTLEAYRLTIDLEHKTVTDDQGLDASFEIDEFRRYCLLHGLDDIGLTLQNEDKITQYELKNGIASHFTTT